MEKRHIFALRNRLDEVVRRGWAELQWWELYRWYGASRIGKNTWRDLLDCLLEELEDSQAPENLHDCFVIQEGQSGVLIVYDAPDRALVKLAAKAEYKTPFKL